MPTADKHKVKPLTFIGPLPPPFNGMTGMSEVVVTELMQLGSVDCYNWSRGKALKGTRWKVARAFGFIRSVLGLAIRGRRPGAVLYYPASSKWGILYDQILLSVAKTLGYRIVLHHHVYSYLDRFDWRMAVVNRIVGRTGAHVVHCDKMMHDFLEHYPTKAEFLFVPPTIVSSQVAVGAPRSFPERTFTLGFLSNLTVAKGLPDVLQTFEVLQSALIDVRLILAGPCQVASIRKTVDDFLKQWGEAVEYRGPVYGEDKQRFFQDIDAFIFPTQTESWGIVLTEALSAGCPVIANDRGCISYMIQGDCGVVVPRDGDFIATAVQQVKTWIQQPDSYESMSIQALKRVEELNEEASVQLPEFVRRVRSMADELPSKSPLF